MKGEDDMHDISSTQTPSPSSLPCNECLAGIMHMRHITYFTWLGDELVMVPRFPAWVCDICGKREYDERAISWLSMLLNPEAGRPTRRIKRPSRPGLRKRNAPPPMLE
jgi:YgiT-type zinc finger domain-containing protein